METYSLQCPHKNSFFELILAIAIKQYQSSKYNYFCSAKKVAAGSFNMSSSRPRDQYGLEARGQASITTPVRGRNVPGRKRRRFDANDILNSVGGPSPGSGSSFYSSTRTPPQPAAYRPNQSLYEGVYHHDDSDSPDENGLNGPTSMELVNMIQEQQRLLQQLLKTQTELVEKQTDIGLKQEEFDEKLEDIMKNTEFSSGSSQKKKFKISRKLTVSLFNGSNCALSFFFP